jgi:hypothetical protein
VLYSQLALYSRGCLTASEVLSLARTGHGSGALARWRTLFETSVVAQFLIGNGDEAAERFMDHWMVDRVTAVSLAHLTLSVVRRVAGRSEVARAHALTNLAYETMDAFAEAGRQWDEAARALALRATAAE